MKVLITGGLGFIGGRVAAHLSGAGHQIILGSRRACEPPFWLPKSDVVAINWGENDSLQDCCNSVDIVIHAAGMNSGDSALNPVGALAFNGVETARLVRAATMAGVKQFIYLSTAHVYANPLLGVLTEETPPTNLHPYATSHLAGEQVVLAATQDGKMSGVVLRISNAFGAPMDGDVNCWMLLANDLCRQAVQTRKLTLHTNGLQERDFIGMNTLCKAVESILMLSARGAELESNVFNIGTGISRTVFEMAKLIQQRCFKVLGFWPDLEVPEEFTNNNNSKLHFRVDRLVNLNVSFNEQENIAEIDRLLNFCQLNFYPSKA